MAKRPDKKVIVGNVLESAKKTKLTTATIRPYS
jgi:hypothetical protein